MTAADDSAGRVVPIGGGGSDGEGDGAGPAREEREVDLSAGGIVQLLSEIPSFGRLLFGLLRDPRVSLVDRALFGATLVYLFTPVDVIPDWMLGLGQLDDLLLVMIALDRLLIGTPEEILLDHWEGDDTPLRTLRELLERGARRLPAWARSVVRMR